VRTRSSRSAQAVGADAVVAQRADERDEGAGLVVGALVEVTDRREGWCLDRQCAAIERQRRIVERDAHARRRDPRILDPSRHRVGHSPEAARQLRVVGGRRRVERHDRRIEPRVADGGVNPRAQRVGSAHHRLGSHAPLPERGDHLAEAEDRAAGQLPIVDHAELLSNGQCGRGAQPLRAFLSYGRILLSCWRRVLARECFPVVVGSVAQPLVEVVGSMGTGIFGVDMGIADVL